MTTEDDKYLVRHPQQVRRLLQALIEQRSNITAHLAGRDRSFPTALLEADQDQDWILLDGSHDEASNNAAEQASHLLCLRSSTTSGCASGSNGSSDSTGAAGSPFGPRSR